MMPGILKLPTSGLLSSAGRAGPRRLILIGLSSLALFVLIVLVTTGGGSELAPSRDAPMQSVDPLPGGLHSTPQMNSLARMAETQQAGAALRSGQSYTPPLAPSVPVFPAPAGSEQVSLQPSPGPVRRVAVRTIRVKPEQVVLPIEASTQSGVVPPPAPARVVAVEATVDPKAAASYNKQIGDLFTQWGGRFPHTDIVTPPSEAAAGAPSEDGPGVAPSGTSVHDTGSITPAAARPAETTTRVLIPAGRGVFAHPILALSSDQSSPAVFQADSGPIAGDRMLGSFSRAGDRLIIHIATIIHQGEQVTADGVVIAPDTMEASVASDVDQHYLTRFILPAAAAFVEGLGNALATTSNTTAVLSPLGGATTSTNLNFRQQLGVAAGTAAAQIGSVLNQAAPKGPTVSLEANVSIGVMFLQNVVSHRD
jgi:intracellular multiplication protein IcmE